MGTVDQRESFSWTQSGEYHQRCPLKTLVSCVELVGEVAEIFFECKLCFLTADLHKGETHFLEHLRSKHPQYYKQPDHIDIKPQIRHIDVNASNENTNVTATSNQNKAVAKPATVSKAPESPNGTADTYVIPSKLEVPDESDVPPQAILPLTHDLSDDDNNYGGGTDVGELSDTEMVPNLPQKDEVLTETETNQVGDGPQEADEKGLQFISEDKSEVANLNDDDEQSDEQEEVAPRRRTRSGQRKAPSKGKGKKKATPKAKPKKAAAKKRKSKIYEDEEEEEEHSDEDYEPETKDDDVTEEDDCVPGKPKKKKTKKSGEPSTKKTSQSRKCDVCGKNYSTASGLKTHYLIHTGEKQRFLRKGDRKKHEKVHKTGESSTSARGSSTSARGSSTSARGSSTSARGSSTSAGGSSTSARGSSTSARGGSTSAGGSSTSAGGSSTSAGVSSTSARGGSTATSCVTCGKLCRHTSEIEAHKRPHTFCTPYLCVLCDAAFEKCSAWKMHKREKHSKSKGTKANLCHLCGKSFNSPGALTEHSNGHLNIRPFACTLCDKRFYQERVLKQHMRIHSKDLQFKCDICHQHFTRKSYLNVHKLIHTDENSSNPLNVNHPCDICGRLFARVGSLSIHKIRVHQDIRHPCDKCDREFRSRTELNYHLLDHEGRNPIKCKECGKTFLFRSRLSEHMLTHTGEKPHVCYYCGIHIRSNGHFCAHIKRHESGKKMYKIRTKDVKKLSVALVQPDQSKPRPSASSKD